jgi:eukaryotic-like serine/threonine-protein kinase
MSVSAALRQALAERYEILRELGRGGTATVYLARDLKYGRQVALKVLSPELALAVRSERFRREIDIAAQLSHPHIVPLFEADSAGDFHYYTMPFIEGESLRDLLARQGRLSVEDSLRFAREVAGALAYAHGRGVIHRDIKPGNILLDAGHARVADFGIARAVGPDSGDTVTQTGTPLGTPAYMSPEQCSADVPIDPRTDVYGLGCVLYEMLTGRPPFQGMTFESILAQKLLEPVPRPLAVRPDVPAWLDAVVATALEKSPDDRLASAAEFATSISREEAPRRRSRWWRIIRRHWRAVSVTAGTVAIAVIVWAWFLGPRPPIDSRATRALDPRRIAVLYFDDLSRDGHLSHVAAGVTSDLINALAKVEALRVISPEGVRPFRGASALLDSIARTLAVGTIVAGSIAQDGDRLRVSVRMLDPATGIQLLSQTIERPIRDLFALEDEITIEVAAGLRARLGPVVAVLEGRAGTRSVAAWELVQRADRFEEDARALNLMGEWRSALRNLGRADSLLRMAEALDPRWTVATVARGWVANDVGLMPPPEGSGVGAAAHLERSFRTGIAHAERALAINPKDAGALQLRGILRYRLWNLSPRSADDSLVTAAERDLRAAIAERPSLARAWHALASLYMDRARFEEAHVAAERALQADAYLTEARSALATLFFTALHLGRAEEARGDCDQGLARYAGDPRFAECRLTLLGWFGRGRRDVADAWKTLAQIEHQDSIGNLSPTWAYRRMLVAVILARSGFGDSALAVIGRTRSDRTHPQGRAALLAEAYAREILGRRSEALQLIEEYTLDNPSGRSYAAATPWFRSLHDDPRFRAAVKAP